ncbi:hypothetical protein [Saccharospirillum salsuginis]|uniref:hypothetical protein n=1 Tax=Saccharospirillum salsuginis TaxID=418750 RepID=UPI00167AB924|nr:hypothetical protein [Saccharospirillum salsuginis]
MIPRFSPALLWFALSMLALAGCSQDTGDSDPTEDQGSAETSPSVRLAGTVATGRPGEWAEVCIGETCSRADAEGEYRLSGEFETSALVSARIPNPDGSETELTSLHRYDSGQTTYLVNINPLTDAVLDAFSHFNRGESLADCRAASGCEQALVDTFTGEVQATVITQLADWAGDAWETPREPFSDPYRADPSLDWLDNLFDHLRFDVDETGLGILDNDGFELGRLPLDTLFDDTVEVLPLDEEQLARALTIEPAVQNTNAIEIRYEVTPGTNVTVPQDVTIDASASFSPGGELTIQHEWVAPDGTVTRYDSASATAPIDVAGGHHWVILATDAQGNRLTTGLDIDALANDVIEDPEFGSEGSCQTTNMTANSMNICEETLDGGALGVCEPTVSGSTQTLKSPAPCSPIEQHGGRFLGVCTVVLNEIRVFHYENPLRNTGLTMAELRALKAEHCVDVFGGSWSTEP